MVHILIAVIYLAFISLGLPDALLGAAWPVMAPEMGAGLSWAGVVSMIISVGTVVSSLLSDRLTKSFGAGLVTAVSALLTAGALLGFAAADAFWMLCLLAIPYGLGAGAVDAALNNYVAVHYTSRYMNWLHCFWGLGASIGPYIMGWALGTGHGWRTGYGAVGAIQIAMTAVLFLTLPLWKKTQADAAQEQSGGLAKAVRVPGVKQILMAFFCYCALEATAFLWSASFLVEFKEIDAQTAASLASLFYLGMTFGRFVSGFVADRMGDENMIRLGAGGMVLGLVLIALPVKSTAVSLAGLLTLGLGAAPVYPAIIHATPTHFGKENSQAIVGIQMACAYVGMTLAPPVFGVLAQHVSMGLFPWFMGVFLLGMWLWTEQVNRICGRYVKQDEKQEDVHASL